MNETQEWPVRLGSRPEFQSHELCDECDGSGWVMDFDWRTTCGACGGWGYVTRRDEDDDEVT